MGGGWGGVAWRGVRCATHRLHGDAVGLLARHGPHHLPRSTAAASPSQLLRGHRRRFPMGRRLLPPLTNASGVMLNACSAGRPLDALWTLALVSGFWVLACRDGGWVRHIDNAGTSSVAVMSPRCWDADTRCKQIACWMRSTQYCAAAHNRRKPQCAAARSVRRGRGRPAQSLHGSGWRAASFSFNRS